MKMKKLMKIMKTKKTLYIFFKLTNKFLTTFINVNLLITLLF